MDHKTYIRRETMVSVAINCVLSALFFWVVFRGVDPVPTWGMGNWVFDFLPQSFMIALMSTLVPGAMAGKAIRAGRIKADGPANWLPGNLPARALVMALVSATFGAGLIAAIVQGIGVEQLSATTALVLKIIYGTILAGIVTPYGLLRALAQSN